MHAGIGDTVRRKEDLRLLTGRGCYSDDFNFPGQVYGAAVRAPHAHAHIRSIDVSAARAMPGVLAVLTGEDALADGLKRIPHLAAAGTPPDIVLHNRDGSAVPVAPHYVLPTDRVRHVGTAVAFVIAETVTAAKDAAERVIVDYEPLPAVTEATAAIAPNAPQLYDDLPNIMIDAEVGDAAATADAFARAAHVTRLDTWINRVTGVPMEPRAAVGIYDATSGRYTLYAGSGGIVRQKKELAAILGVPFEAVRVIAREIGGNFGTRNSFFPEFALVAWGSRRVGRPVKWTCERHEAFITDYMGRDLTVSAELALDADGRFLALRTKNLSNVGAHSGSYVPLVKGVGLVTAGYRIATAHISARAVLSTTMPTTPYRSAGRPEVIYVIERLIDKAALEHGFDRVALRRRNLIPPSAFPYKNPQGITYDNGTYRAVMDRAMELGDWKGFKRRRAEARKRRKLRGIGLCCYLETTGGYPRERADIAVHPQGRVDVVVGTLSSGQSHETTFAQCVAEWLGVPFDDVNVIESDTDIVKEGGGSHSARSMRLAGIVMGKASDLIIEKGKKIAAHMLETAEDDMSFAAGRFTVKGTDRSVGIFDVAQAAADGKSVPDDLSGPLAATSDETIQQLGFPYGAHVCEVEIDPQTGALEIAAYTAVDDVGRAINPMVVDGQTHGGAAQGIGQALWEQCAYDGQGQLLSASFMDYAMPRADILPSFTTDISQVLTPTNRLGVRGAGEGGTTGALGAVVNAVVDALAEFGVTHIEMPVTPERIGAQFNHPEREATKGEDMADILTKQDGPILRITLNQPERGNAVSDEMVAELTGIIEGAENTSSIVVLRGAGKDFCVGRAVMGATPKKDPDALERRTFSDVVFNCYGAMRNAKIPIIAVVHGRALGFGCAIAAACDITLAGDKAVFQVPEMAHNILPTMVMSSFVDRVPRKAMSYLVYSTAEITPERALSFGIVSDVVPAAKLDEAVETLCAAILKAPRPAILGVKEYVKTAPDMAVFGAVEFARNLHATVNSSSEMRRKH